MIFFSIEFEVYLDFSVYRVSLDSLGNRVIKDPMDHLEILVMKDYLDSQDYLVYQDCRVILVIQENLDLVVLLVILVFLVLKD